MALFKRKKENPNLPCALQTQRGGEGFALSLSRYQPLSGCQEELYSQLRRSVPIIDAAIGKLVRLCGGFTVETKSAGAQSCIDDFVGGVKVGAFGIGLESFISSYLEQLLTYGTAVGEIVPMRSGRKIYALYNIPLGRLEIEKNSDIQKARLCARTGGEIKALAHPELVTVSTLNPEPGEFKGVSLLRGLPFVSSILMGIYNTIGLNWERLGNLRYSVTYKPDGGTLDSAFAKERAMQIAEEWTKAMENTKAGRISDFVTVGDVSIKVIGADNQILDSQVPVKQLLEQIVAKLGVPPFLLGLSWSSTERMSVQQADILTSELESFRRIITPVIEKICNMQLYMAGHRCGCKVHWQDIDLLDSVEEARARLYNAQAVKLEEGR